MTSSLEPSKEKGTCYVSPLNRCQFDFSEPLALNGGPKQNAPRFLRESGMGTWRNATSPKSSTATCCFIYSARRCSSFRSGPRHVWPQTLYRLLQRHGRGAHRAGRAGAAAGQRGHHTGNHGHGVATGMLYQGLVPVFADLDPATLTWTRPPPAAALRPAHGPLVVHHSGLAAEMDAFLDWAASSTCGSSEDCAQAYGTAYKGRLAGTMGGISAFSLNHFKHITCGSGGMVIPDDDRLALSGLPLSWTSAFSARRRSATPSSSRPIIK